MQNGHAEGRECLAAICPKCLKLLNVDNDKLIVRVHKGDDGTRCPGSALSIVGWRLDRAPSGKLVFIQAGWNHSSSREQGMRFEHEKLKARHWGDIPHDGFVHGTGMLYEPHGPEGERFPMGWCGRLISGKRDADSHASSLDRVTCPECLRTVEKERERSGHKKLKVVHMQAVHFPASYSGEGCRRGVCSTPVDPLGFSEDTGEVTCTGCLEVLAEGGSPGGVRLVGAYIDEAFIVHAPAACGAPAPALCGRDPEFFDVPEGVTCPDCVKELEKAL